MNLCGSFRAGGAAREVEPERYLLAGIDFRGAMVVDLGLGICKHKKSREGEERTTKILLGGKMKSHSNIYRLKICARYATT